MRYATEVVFNNPVRSIRMLLVSICALMLSRPYSCLSLVSWSPVLCAPVLLSPILRPWRGLGLTRIELTSKTNDCSEDSPEA